MCHGAVALYVAKVVPPAVTRPVSVYDVRVRSVIRLFTASLYADHRKASNVTVTGDVQGKLPTKASWVRSCSVTLSHS